MSEEIDALLEEAYWDDLMGAHLPFAMSCKQDSSCPSPDKCRSQKVSLEHYMRCPVGWSKHTLLQKEAEKYAFRPTSDERQRREREIRTLYGQTQQCAQCDAYLSLLQAHTQRCNTTLVASRRSYTPPPPQPPSPPRNGAVPCPFL